MTGEIVRRDLDSWTDVVPFMGDLAGKIANTEFVPKSLRGNPAAIVACMLYGREIGIGLMESLQSIDVVDGSPTPNAELQRGLVLAAGHHFDWVERTNTRCVVEGKRVDNGDALRVSYTIDDARAAGLVGRDNWKKRPRAMLTARATSELCRTLFPDVVKGLGYTADELLEANVDTATGEIAPEPPTARRTARRATRNAPPVSHDPSEPQAVTAAPTVVDEPPLDELEPIVEPVVEPVEPVVKPTKPVEPGEHLAARALAHVGQDDDTQPATDAQSKKALALFNACEWTDREDRLRAASAIIGRPVTTFKELTKDEASSLIEALVYAAAADDPAQMLADIVSTGIESVIAEAVEGEIIE